MHGSVVLMYHGIGQPARRGEDSYTVSTEQLDAHMRLITTVADVVTLDQLLAGHAPPGAVAVTFDDGEASVIREALPVLDRYKISATVFMTTGWIDSAGYLGATDLLTLSAHGWTVGGHGVTHRYLSDLEPAAREWELCESLGALAGILGQAPRHMSLPGGRAPRTIVDEVRRAGYASLSTSQIRVNAIMPDPFCVGRVPVRRDTSMEQMYRIVRGDARYFLRATLSSTVFSGAKRLLGNRRYEQARRRALGLAKRLRRS